MSTVGILTVDDDRGSLNKGLMPFMVNIDEHMPSTRKVRGPEVLGGRVVTGCNEEPASKTRPLVLQRPDIRLTDYSILVCPHSFVQTSRWALGSAGRLAGAYLSRLEPDHSRATQAPLLVNRSLPASSSTSTSKARRLT